jgi:alanyl-tRNA synthetase
MMEGEPAMAIPVYHRDAYLTELESQIVECGTDGGRPFAILSDTVFYPEGGGQPADRGTIAGVAVVDVQKAGDTIRHSLRHPLHPGPVHLELDWPRRWDHMQQHTAQHLLTAVALRDFGWRTTAFHLGPDVSDIELGVPELAAADLERLEQTCSVEVRAARAISQHTAEVTDFERLGVRSRRLPDGFEGTVRLVEIDGLDLNTCGGTHLRSTAEIGALCLLGTEPMRGGTRLFFVAGDRVRRRMAAHEARNRELRSLLDTGDDELADIVRVRLTREKDLARKARTLAEELADRMATALATRSEAVVEAHWEDRDMAFLQRVARMLVEAAPEMCGLLTATDDGDLLFVVAAGEKSAIDPGETGPRVAEALGGRGGGRGSIFQGKAGSFKDRDRALEILRG